MSAASELESELAHESELELESELEGELELAHELLVLFDRFDYCSEFAHVFLR